MNHVETVNCGFLSVIVERIEGGLSLGTQTVHSSPMGNGEQTTIGPQYSRHMNRDVVVIRADEK